MSVDFPAPLAPTRPTTPDSTSTVSASRAVLRVGGRQHVVPGAVEDPAGQVAQGRFVLDDQDDLPGAGGFRCRIGGRYEYHGGRLVGRRQQDGDRGADPRLGVQVYRALR